MNEIHIPFLQSYRYEPIWLEEYSMDANIFWFDIAIEEVYHKNVADNVRSYLLAWHELNKNETIYVEIL